MTNQEILQALEATIKQEKAFYNGEPYISVGHDYKLGGGGSPSDTIEQAIKYFKYVIDVCR